MMIISSIISYKINDSSTFSLCIITIVLWIDMFDRALLAIEYVDIRITSTYLALQEMVSND